MRTRERAAATYLEWVSKRNSVDRERSDGELLRCFLDHGEEPAFVVLIARHGRKMFAVCRRVIGHHQDAEDAFQDALLKLLREADALREGQDLGCWLTRTAFGLALNVRRSRKRRQKHERQCQNCATAQQHDEILLGETRDHIDAAISELPEQWRAPFISCFVEGKSRSEVALELGWPEGTVASRVRQARKILRRELERGGIIP